MVSNNFAINEFNLADMIACPAILIIGKLDAEVLANNILRSNKFNTITDGVLIAPSEKFFINSCYKKIPHLKNNTFDKYNKKILETLFSYQKEKKSLSFNKETVLVLDNCMSIKTPLDDTLKEVICYNKYHNIPLIFSMKYPLGFSPEIRSEFDYVFLLPESFYSIKKKFYEHYAGMFESFHEFDDIFTLLTKNSDCVMVIDNRTEEVDAKVCWYKINADINNEYNYGITWLDQN